jgi:hypothetical protein
MSDVLARSAAQTSTLRKIRVRFSVVVICILIGFVVWLVVAGKPIVNRYIRRVTCSSSTTECHTASTVSAP